MRIASNFIFEIANIINEQNSIVAPEQRKNFYSILSDELCEEQAFPYFLPRGKFHYNGP